MQILHFSPYLPPFFNAPHSGAGKMGSEKGAGAGTAGGGPGPSGQKAETVFLSKNALDNGEVLRSFLVPLQLTSSL